MGKFDDVKVGDNIKYTLGISYWSKDFISPVTSVTKASFTVKGNVKFRKKDGKMIGSSTKYAEYATDDEVKCFMRMKKADAMRANIRSYLNASLETMSVEQIEELHDFLLKQKKNGQEQQSRQSD